MFCKVRKKEPKHGRDGILARQENGQAALRPRPSKWHWLLQLGMALCVILAGVASPANALMFGMASQPLSDASPIGSPFWRAAQAEMALLTVAYLCAAAAIFVSRLPLRGKAPWRTLLPARGLERWHVARAGVGFVAFVLLFVGAAWLLEHDESIARVSVYGNAGGLFFVIGTYIWLRRRSSAYARRSTRLDVACALVAAAAMVWMVGVASLAWIDLLLLVAALTLGGLPYLQARLSADEQAELARIRGTDELGALDKLYVSMGIAQWTCVFGGVVSGGIFAATAVVGGGLRSLPQQAVLPALGLVLGYAVYQVCTQLGFGLGNSTLMSIVCMSAVFPGYPINARFGNGDPVQPRHFVALAIISLAFSISALKKAREGRRTKP